MRCAVSGQGFERVAILCSMGLAIAMLSASVVTPPCPRLVWNATASVPRGLYAVEADGPLVRGDYVVAQVPRSFRRLAAARGYLPARIPLVKPVSAVTGDSVCALGQEILINGRQVGDRLAQDSKGRPMPGWSGCVRLKVGEVFLFRAGMPKSFDGRYFGITPRSAILGKADPLWLR